MSHLPWTTFFGRNHYYYFHLPIGPFCCAKFKIFFTADPELWGCTIFGPKNGPFAPNKVFCWKLLISFSSTYKPLSLCKILKKFFQWIQSYEDAQFLGPEWPISPNEDFFRTPINEPCFFNSCLSTRQSLSTCQTSKSDINLWVKYWRLRILKSRWLRGIFGYNLKTKFSPSMQFSQNANES